MRGQSEHGAQLGLFYWLTRSRCEPDGKHYFAVEACNTREMLEYNVYPSMK